MTADLAAAKAGAPASATAPEAKPAKTDAAGDKPPKTDAAGDKPPEAKAADGKASKTGAGEDKPVPTVVIEDKKRLSQSLIWKLQRAFYASAGPLAWKPSGVPFYITSNPHIAQCYARVFSGALRDLVSVIDPKEPVYIIELAAGSGQFSYLFLKSLLRMKAGAARARRTSRSGT